MCTAFALLHSLLAARPVKHLVRQTIGGRSHDGLYRLAFSLQSAILATWAIRWFNRLPDREVYRQRGLSAWILRGVQVASLGTLLSSVRVVGVGRFLGVAQCHALLRGRTPPATPEAQGPPLAVDGAMDARGPFRFVRHPESLAVVGVLCCDPRMTVNRVALAAAFSLYMILGSRHEDRRLQAAYGTAFERYARRVPFMLPPLSRPLRVRLRAVRHAVSRFLRPSEPGRRC